MPIVIVYYSIPSEIGLTKFLIKELLQVDWQLAV